MGVKRFRPSSHFNPKAMTLWVGVFAVIGVTTLLLTNAATPGSLDETNSTTQEVTASEAAAASTTATTVTNDSNSYTILVFAGASIVAVVAVILLAHYVGIPVPKRSPADIVSPNSSSAPEPNSPKNPEA